MNDYHPNTHHGRRVYFSLVRNSDLHCRGRCRFNSCPRPIRATWQMQIWGLAVFMLWCFLCVADLIVGMAELELHYRCRGRSNFRRIHERRVKCLFSHSFCTDFFGFSPGNAGKNSLVVRSLFLRPFSGKFSGANFCFEVSICALHVLVPSGHSFCTDFFGFSPGNAGEKFSCGQVWFSATFFGKIFGRELLFQGLDLRFACFGAF